MYDILIDFFLTLMVFKISSYSAFLTRYCCEIVILIVLMQHDLTSKEIDSLSLYLHEILVYIYILHYVQCNNLKISVGRERRMKDTIRKCIVYK